MLNTHLKPLSKNYICKTSLETVFLFRTPLKTFFHLILKLDFDHHLKSASKMNEAVEKRHEEIGNWDEEKEDEENENGHNVLFLEREIELLELKVWHLRSGMVCGGGWSLKALWSFGGWGWSSSEEPIYISLWATTWSRWSMNLREYKEFTVNNYNLLYIFQNS